MTIQAGKKKMCQICKKAFSLSKLYPGQLITHSVLEFIKKQHPDWSSNEYICLKDLRKYRNGLITSLFAEEKGELSELDHMVFNSLKEHELLTENTNRKYERKLTFAERAADKVAKVGGSWPFIFFFFGFIIMWTIFNSIQLIEKPFDPFPFILLNLTLSCLAAIQAPIIMMSQNRHAAKDRLRDDDEYCINLKAELELRHLQAKMDFFIKKQWERLLEIQHIQLDLAEDLLEKKLPKKR